MVLHTKKTEREQAALALSLFSLSISLLGEPGKRGKKSEDDLSKLRGGWVGWVGAAS